MKKIVAILIAIMLGVTLFVGCGKEKETPQAKQVRNLEEQITSVYKDSDSYIQPYDNNSDMERLDIYIKLKKENKTSKDLSSEYNEICKKILHKIKFSAVKIEKIQLINFKAIIDGGEVKDSNIECEKFTKQKGVDYFDFSGTLTKPKDFKVVTEELKEITLKEGMFEVGKDIEPGRYMCKPIDGTGKFIVDDKGTVIINEVLDSTGKAGVKTVTCDFTKDEIVKIDDVKKVKFIPVKRKVSNKLTAGIWKVGVDIKQGNYIAKAEQGAGNLVVEDNGSQIINEVLDANGENGSKTVQCNLTNGETIIVSSLNEVYFESK